MIDISHDPILLQIPFSAQTFRVNRIAGRPALRQFSTQLAPPSPTPSNPFQQPALPSLEAGHQVVQSALPTLQAPQTASDRQTLLSTSGQIDHLSLDLLLQHFLLLAIGLPERDQLVLEIGQGLSLLGQTALARLNFLLHLLPTSPLGTIGHLVVGVAKVGVEVGAVDHLTNHSLLVLQALTEAGWDGPDQQARRDAPGVDPRRVGVLPPTHQHQPSRVLLGFLLVFPAGIHRFVVWIPLHGSHSPSNSKAARL